MHGAQNYSSASCNNSHHHTPERHSRDVFHAWMLDGARFAGPFDMAVLKAVHAEPDRLVAFSDAMSSKWRVFDCWVHCFEDDAIINRFWNNPKGYVDRLRKFQGVIGLDYSVGWNFPVAVKNYNHFRNNACTYWLQAQGLSVVPQARCENDDYEKVLAGHPHHSTIAIGARSMVRNPSDRDVLVVSVRNIVDYLSPSNILWYGSDLYGVADYPRDLGIPVMVYPGKGKGSLSHHQEP